MLKYLVAWFPMVLIAMANGALREFTYKASLGDLRAHQLSTLMLLIFFSVYIWFIIRTWPPASSQRALLIGVMWLVLTLAFEFGWGRLRGESWETLLHDYDLFAGHVWIFIPLWVALAPYVFYKLRK